MISFLLYSHYSGIKPVLEQLGAPVTKRASCPGPGTFVNGTGGCECSAETPFGDPESETGCWACNPQCDLNAQCVQKNTCVCNEGFIGDGIDICEKPVPNLKSLAPKEGFVVGGTEVDFKIFVNATNYTVTRAFCKFGPVIVDASEMDASHIKCVTHQTKPGKVKVSVGFDAIKWSKESFIFTFKETGVSSFTIIFYIIVVILVLLAVGMIIWYANKGNQLAETQDEILPLNKWHMNAPRINPQTEKSWLDFLWNIAIE